MLWLWTLRDVAIIGIGLLLSVLALAQSGFLPPLVVTVLFAFLSIRVEDASILDFLRYAVCFLFLKQQYYHSKMDMYCSVAVLVGLLGSLFGMPSLDKIAAIIAMVLLMIAGYEILSSNLHLLLHPEEDTGAEHGHHHHGLPGGKKLYAGIGGVLACAWLLSGIYVVQMDESGIVRRFGSVVNDAVTPGIHYKLPAPIETVTLVKAENVSQVETGVQELLTGDTNLVNVNLSVHYKIENSADYLLNVSNSEALLQSSATTSIRQIVGENTIDYTLTDGKPEIESSVQQALQETMDRNGTGLEIVSVQLVEAAPPEAVLSSFEDLATARQDSVIYINEATAYPHGEGHLHTTHAALRLPLGRAGAGD